MSVITLGNIKNPKHAKFLQKVSDVFDEHRGNIPDDLAFTRFNGMNHVILFNTANPELNGKSLIQFDNDKVLFAPTEIKSLICNEPQNNASINILTIPDNNHIWEAKSEDKIIKLLINLRDKSPIEGFSIRFQDSVRTKYRMTLTLANDDNEILSQVASGMDSSWETNNQQFFQLSNPVEGVTKVVMDIELVGQNKDFEWKVNNISFYSKMNLESLKQLSKLGVITWSLVQNAVFIKDLEQQKGGSDLLKMEQPEQGELFYGSYAVTDIDHYGSPIPYKPITNRQFFDNLTDTMLVKMTNIPRLYTITDMPTGDKVFTFETTLDRKLELKFTPLREMNMYPDEPVVQMDKITNPPGEIKKGGFKNYCLTFYIKLDGLNLTDQKLIWKYGGYYFDISRPELARAVNVTIPVNNASGSLPTVQTEYFLGKLNDMSGMLQIIDGRFKGLEEGKWIGIQCIRQVDTQNKHAVQTVRINEDPFNPDKGSIDTSHFVDYLRYDDTVVEDHTPAIWGGVQELISVTGAKYVSLYGISLYEVEYNIE